MAGVILGVALGTDRVCAVRSDRLSSVETWTFSSDSTDVPIGERVVTAIGVMQVRALRESVTIDLIKIAAPEAQASLLRTDAHLVGVGDIEFVDALGAQWGGILAVTRHSSNGDVAWIDIGSASIVARIVDLTGTMRIAGERSYDPLARGRSVTAELTNLLADITRTDTTPEKVFVSGKADDESAVQQVEGALPVTFVGETVALAAQGALELGASKKAASNGPRHAARHAAKPVAKKKRWYR